MMYIMYLATILWSFASGGFLGQYAVNSGWSGFKLFVATMALATFNGFLTYLAVAHF